MTVTIGQPVASSTVTQTRILGYDFARALAVLGMFIVNFKLVMEASDAGPDWFVGMVGLLEGRAAATFVMLAGVGLSLLSAKARHSSSDVLRATIRKLVFKRAIFLFVFGLLYAPIWPADILHFYGLYIAVAVLVLYVPDRKLLWWAVGFTGLFAVMMLVLNYEAGWDWDALEYTDFWTPVGLIRHMLFNGWHPMFPWTAFVLLGMWLGRQDIRNPQLQNHLLIISLIALVMSEASSIVLTSVFTPMLTGDISSALFSRNMVPPMPLYIISGSATAMIVIVLSVRFAERFQDAQWLQPFIATGQLALSLYVAHVLIGMGLIEALGWFSGQSLAVSVSYSLLFYAGAMLFAFMWRQQFKRGPIEWIMRRLTG